MSVPIWIKCPLCTMKFSVQQEWLDNKERNDVSFYCPNGCSIKVTPRGLDIKSLIKARDQAIKERDTALADVESLKRTLAQFYSSDEDIMPETLEPPPKASSFLRKLGWSKQ